MVWLVALLGLVGCHVYNEDYACIPRTAVPCGGVIVRNCVWLNDEDAGIER